ncbi:MAG: ABC transporter permease [Clostridioides sp.]|nr:ABC transporter permease [Clostridioides sp.]
MRNASKSNNFMDTLYRIIVIIAIIALWQVTAIRLGSPLLLPEPLEVFKGLVICVTDIEILKNLGITLQRVLKGFGFAFLIGIPIGILMGFSRKFEKAVSPIIDSIRQVPIMAWVPLTIVWFGIGDGPTIFLIGFSGVFPIILNTMQGVRAISKDYYNAARSMGASPISIFFNVMLPSALPDILTGSRLAISTGWMSVI